MTTQERIQLLVDSGQSPEFLANFSDKDLKKWLTAELGNEKALDQFTQHGKILSKAVAAKNILHIVSGNTPHGAIQSLLRGLLLGSNNIIKPPSEGLPDLTQWINKLHPELQKNIQVETQLTDAFFETSDIIIAIGSDKTMRKIQKKIQPHQVFIPHGHKVSIGVATNDFKKAAHLAAIDISLFNQRGCLSPHIIYVKENKEMKAEKFSELLAQEMEIFSKKQPALPLNLSEAGAIRNLRETTRFFSANSSKKKLWESQNNLNWTVIFDTFPTLTLSCLNRCVYVKPLPKSLSLESLGTEINHLSTISIHPFERSFAETLSHLPANRICAMGKSQYPTVFWHHDGIAPLSCLVRWKDIG